MPVFVPMPSSPSRRAPGRSRAWRAGTPRRARRARVDHAALAEAQLDALDRHAARAGRDGRSAMRPSAESSCGPVKTSPEGMLRFPSEFTHVRPSTRRRRSVPSASMCSSRAPARRSISAAWRARSSVQAADGIVLVEERRAPHEVGELRRAPCPPAGRRRRSARTCRTSAAQARLPDRAPRPRGARQARRIDAGQRAGVVGRLDDERGVGALGLRQLGGREGVEMRVARRRPPLLALPGQLGAQERPRLALQQLALEREQERGGERRGADDHLVAGPGLEAVAAQQAREGGGIRTAIRAARRRGSARRGARARRRGSSAARRRRRSGSGRAGPSGA